MGRPVTGIFTASGDLAMSAPAACCGFSALAQHPIKFILKYWTNEPTVGVRDGDIFMHNDARYGSIHNTDQSMIMPVFDEGKLVCFAGAIVHEGENGSMRAGRHAGGGGIAVRRGPQDAARSRSARTTQFRRDLVTFLQNSVRDPKLQLEDMKVKLYAVLRMQERVERHLAEYGEDAVVATLRSTLEDTVDEVRRRSAELAGRHRARRHVRRLHAARELPDQDLPGDHQEGRRADPRLPRLVAAVPQPRDQHASWRR